MKVAVSHLAFVLGTVKIMVGHFHRLAKVCVVDSVIPHVHEPSLSRPKYDVMAPECSANTRGLKDDQACTQPSTILTLHITLEAEE